MGGEPRTADQTVTCTICEKPVDVDAEPRGDWIKFTVRKWSTGEPLPLYFCDKTCFEQWTKRLT